MFHVSFISERAEAADEEVSHNATRGRQAKSKQKAFQKAVTSRLAPWKAQDGPKLLKYYADMKHSIDLWHKAKNLRYKVYSVSLHELFTLFYIVGGNVLFRL